VETQDLLDKALSEPIGIAALCTSRDSADVLRRTLYAARLKLREAGVSKYDVLSFSISPQSSDILYIYHRERLEELKSKSQ
jgi:hypothetical protein